VWVDFKESKDVVAEVLAAADGLGVEGAVVAAGDVSYNLGQEVSIFPPILLACFQARPFNQALMFLRSKATLVCVGMPAGTALLNVPLTLLIAKVRF
jgi:propanol-preferring alcohol dehydrogenase